MTYTYIPNSKVYHFADDTNLLHINSYIKGLRKNINYDLKRLTNWLDANMISLNCTKTELIYFHKKISTSPTNIKIKLNGKRLPSTDHIKYLGVYLDETLSGFAQIMIYIYIYIIEKVAHRKYYACYKQRLLIN